MKNAIIALAAVLVATPALARDCNGINFDMSLLSSQMSRAQAGMANALAQLQFAAKAKDNALQRLAASKARMYASDTLGIIAEFEVLAVEGKAKGGCGTPIAQWNETLETVRAVKAKMEGAVTQ
jgi:hypothetical protein